MESDGALVLVNTRDDVAAQAELVLRKCLASIHRVSTARDAVALARTQPDLSLVIIEVGADERSLQELALITRREPDRQRLVVLATSRVLAEACLNAAATCGALYTVGVPSPVVLMAMHARSMRTQGATRVERAVRMHASRFGFTDAEEYTLRLCVNGVPRAKLASTAGVAPATIKSRVRAMLQKTGDEDMSLLVQRVLLAALRLT